MRNLKRFYAVAIALVMLVSLIVPVSVTGAADYASKAQTLYNLGLYKGVSTTPGEFNPDLGATLNRQTAATMVLRLFGVEDDALAMDEMEAKEILEAKFKDAASVDAWALKQVAYAVDSGIIQGYPDGTFAPKGLLKGQEYCVLLLKMLGYSDWTYATVAKRFAEVAGLTSEEEMAFGVGASIPKSILVGASYAALTAIMEGTTSTLAEDLVKDGIFDANQVKVAMEAGLVDEVAPTTAPTVDPSASPVGTPVGTPAPTVDPNVTVDPNATVAPVSYDKDVVVTATSNPSVMAQEVNDFNFLNLKVKNNNATNVSLSQFTVEMDKFLGVNTKVKDIKIWEGTSKKSPGTARWSGSTYSAVINLTTPLVIKAGEEKTLKVTADVGVIGTGTPDASLGEQYKFTITSMNFGGSPVVGLPYVGNPVGVSTVTAAGTVEITDETISSAIKDFSVGATDVEVGKFKLKAPDDEKVTLNSLFITNAGANIGSGEIDSVEIYNGTTLLGSAGFENDIIFTNPLEIAAAASVVLTVKINTTTDIDNNTDTFRVEFADTKDIDATGSKFGSNLELNQTLLLKNTYTAKSSSVTVSGIQSSQSITALQGAKDFKLGTVFIKNTNVEDIRLSTLKLNIVPTLAITATTLQNIRLMSPDGKTVLASSTNLGVKDQDGGTNENADDNNDWVVTFSLSNEYAIAKNTEVGFPVLVDVNSTAAASRTVKLTYYQKSADDTYAHLTAIGQSSGATLYPSTSAVSGNVVTIAATTSQKVNVVEATNWETTNLIANQLPAGSGRIVANWKIREDATDALKENAEITKIILINQNSDPATSPAAYYLQNFELYHDGVKVASAPAMTSDHTVTFGDGSTTIFTVTDGDEVGKALVVKSDISYDVTTDSQVNFNFSEMDVRGASTGDTLGKTYTSLPLTSPKLLQPVFATFTNVPIESTSATPGSSTEVLRFTVTPRSGKTVNLSDMAITLNDVLGTTTMETIKIFDVTNSANVTLAGTAKFTTGLTTTQVAFALAPGDEKNKLLSVSEPITFAVRVDTTNSGGKSFQIGIDFTADRVQVDAPIQSASTSGWAPIGDRILGKTVNVVQ